MDDQYSVWITAENDKLVSQLIGNLVSEGFVVESLVDKLIIAHGADQPLIISLCVYKKKYGKDITDRANHIAGIVTKQMEDLKFRWLSIVCSKRTNAAWNVNNIPEFKHYVKSQILS